MKLWVIRRELTSLVRKARGRAAAPLRFRRQFRAFRKASGRHPRLPVTWRERGPCLGDAQGTASFDRHCFFHQAWAARVLAESRPAEHVDVSSHLDFVSILSAFIPVRILEFHPPEAELDGLTVAAGNLTRLPLESDSVSSLSCMHVVEYVGLGRYGDALDPEGEVKAVRELARVLAPGGQLLLVVPVGRPRVVFNAHRVYSWEVLRRTPGELEVREFALIPASHETGDLIRDASPSLIAGQDYACGCLRLTKGKGWA